MQKETIVVYLELPYYDVEVDRIEELWRNDKLRVTVSVRRLPVEFCKKVFEILSGKEVTETIEGEYKK